MWCFRALRFKGFRVQGCRVLEFSNRKPEPEKQPTLKLDSPAIEDGHLQCTALSGGLRV